MQQPNENIRDLLSRGERYLVDNGVPNARRNAEWMLGHVLDCHSTDLYLNSLQVVDSTATVSYDQLILRRGEREPLQYILGSTEFMGLEFAVSKGVFIPRPETELLIGWLESWAMQNPARSLHVLDLCCGSGVIAVSLAKRVPAIRAVAVDVLREAVELTAGNAYRNGVLDKLECIHIDAVDYLSSSGRHFDIVVSNPPYVPTSDLASLPPEIRFHEAPLSLDGGRDGLDFYRAAIPHLGGALNASGVVAFEVAHEQARSVESLLRAAGFPATSVVRDYSDSDRLVAARRK